MDCRLNRCIESPGEPRLPTVEKEVNSSDDDYGLPDVDDTSEYLYTQLDRDHQYTPSGTATPSFVSVPATSSVSSVLSSAIPDVASATSDPITSSASALSATVPPNSKKGVSLWKGRVQVRRPLL